MTALLGHLALLVAYRRDQADYYISSIDSARSNSNPGTSRNAPWATIAPLLALGATAGALTGKRVAFERGGTYDPMDLVVFTCDDCTFKSYGGSIVLPFFDLTAAIPAGWTLRSAGVYSIPLSRQADAKNRGNYFRAGVPMRKVQNEAALAGKPAYTCYVQGETGATPLLMMNAPADPNTDGAAYRFSKFGLAVALNGSRNTIDGLWCFGNTAQDGGFRLGGGSGGNTLSNCRMDWGSRHSAYIGSGTLASYCLNNIFNGGANEIEDGDVLSTGTANGPVFNSPNHSTATCVSSGNTYNGMGRANPISGARYNFTGPYGHDGVAGRPMLRFESTNDTFIDMAQGPGACGQVNVFANPTFTRCIEGMSINAANISIEMYGASSGSAIDRLFANLVNAGVTCYLHDCPLITIPDCGAGGAGWVLAGTGSTAVTNMRIEDCNFNIAGIQAANANRFFLYIRAGTLTFKRNKVGPNLAPPIALMFNLGAAVTVDAANDGNFWANGINFSKGGTTYYGLAGWQAATGTESTSSTLAMPTADFTDNFNGADANLETVSGWSRLNGAAGDLQRKSNQMYCAISGGPTAYTRGDVTSDDQYARFNLQNLSSGGGAALRVVDQSNLFWIRATATAFNVMKILAGTVTNDAASTGITPLIGADVICVIRRHIDPITAAASLRVWIIQNGALGAVMFPITGAPMDTERTCGAVARTAISPLLDDLTFGPAPLLLAA